MTDTEDEQYFLEPKQSDLFKYCLDKDPYSILTNKPFTAFTYKLDCYFYDGITDLCNKTLFFYVYSKIPLTYKCAFDEINKQFREQLEALVIDINKKYDTDFIVEDFICDHIFLEDLIQTTPIQYDIFCGS